MASIDELDVIFFENQKKFETWMARNHDKYPDGICVLRYKKATGKKSMTYAEALDVCLCYGWIDGQGKGVDEESSKQRWLPRRSKSIWSKLNTEHVARLMAEGRMKPSGIAAVDAAKADGRWDAAYSLREIPEDFLKALAKNKKAKKFYDTLKKSQLTAISFRVQTAKKPETRARRIQQFVDLLAEEKLP